MADPRAGPVLGHQIGRVGHALHSASDDHVGRPCSQGIMGHDRGLHPRPAHLIDSRGLDGFRESPAQPGLSRRGLAQAARQHTTHDDLIGILWVQARTLDGCPNRCGTEFGGFDRGKHPLKSAHRCAGIGGNDDRVRRVHRRLPQCWR